MDHDGTCQGRQLSTAVIMSTAQSARQYYQQVQRRSAGAGHRALCSEGVELGIVGEIRGVLQVIHITIRWRDARNAIVP